MLDPWYQWDIGPDGAGLLYDSGVSGLLFWQGMRRYRDGRYNNVWLIGCGPALHLSGALNESYGDSPMVVDIHDQTLKCLLFQSGLTSDDLQPA